MLVTESLLSTDVLQRGNGRWGHLSHHHRIAEGSRHPREAGLLIATPTNMQVELAVGVVVSVAAIDDGRAHPISGRLEEQLIDHEVDVSDPRRQRPGSVAAGVGSGDVRARFMKKADAENDVADWLMSEEVHPDRAGSPG